MLATYPTTDWKGGKAQFIRSSVIHLTRGHVFNIDGKRIFAMGGASSHDIQDGILEPEAPDFRAKRKALDALGAMYRINHISWWKEELPSQQEYQIALENLKKCNWKVDYVISHCCPTSIQDIIGAGLYQPDALTGFFEEIKSKLDFKYWLFGHYHDNRVIGRKFILLYEQIIEME